MKRNIIAVVVGYALWTVLWLGGNALFFGETARQVEAQEPVTAGGSLAGIVLLSVVCSIAAGLSCAAISHSRGALLVLGALLLVTGIGVQSSVWALMPVWYHLLFLALLIPVVWFAGKQLGLEPAASGG